MSGSPYSGYFARVAATKERRKIRELWKCSHQPLCESLAIHTALAQDDADAKAARIAETLSERPLARFTVVECTDPGVLARTTARRIFFVRDREQPRDDPGHAVLVDRETYFYHCALHPLGCEAIRAALSHALNEVLGEPGTEPTDPIAGATPERGE